MDLRIAYSAPFFIAAVFIFGLSIFGYKAFINRNKTIALFIVSAIIILLVWTNGYHKLVFVDYFRI